MKKQNKAKLSDAIIFAFKTTFKINKFYFVFIFLNMILLSVAPLIMVIFPKLAIDSIYINGDFVSSNFSKALVFIIIMVALNYFSDIIKIFISSKTTIQEQHINFSINENLATKAISIEYEKLENPQTYDEFEFAKTCVEHMGVSVLIDGFTKIISGIITIISISYLISSVFVIIPAIVAVFGIRALFESKQKKLGFKFNQKNQEYVRKLRYSSLLTTDYSFAKETRLFNFKDFILNKFLSYYTVLYKRTDKFNRQYIIYNFFISLLNNLMLLVLYGFIAFLYINKTIGLGDFAMYMSAIFAFNNAVKSIFSSLSGLNGEKQYIISLKTFLALTQPMEPGIEDIGLNNLEIEFNDVWYMYPGQTEFTLKGINIKLNFCEKLSIVGINGAGKTTFIKLLMRLLSPTKGEILLNGINIKNYSFSKYTELFSTVFQDFIIYGYSVEDNISLNNNVDTEKVKQTLKKIDLMERINLLPKKEKTLMTKKFDDTGIDLSGGQQQKLAIARALYKNSPIYILDEPTAALSPQAEHDIYKHFQEITKNKTVVYISHRMASSRFCNKIAVFENGTIIEYGTHDELLALRKVYFEMYNSQAHYFMEKG